MNSFNQKSKNETTEILQLVSKNKPASKQVECIITVNEHSKFEGIKVPAKMNATWKLDKGDCTWLNLEIINIRYNFLKMP